MAIPEEQTKTPLLNIYLDIDGVLRGTLSPKSDLIELLTYILDHFPDSTYWLTTHCKHDYNHCIACLQGLFPDDLVARLDELVQPTDWSTAKTEAIDFTTPFFWLDDNLFRSEREILQSRHVFSSHFAMDPQNPHMAIIALRTLQQKVALLNTYDLARFKTAQAATPQPLIPENLTKTNFTLALSEIQSGQKRTHWLWYIFPQLRRLGTSDTSVYYGLADLDEAKLYLKDSLLRRHYLEITSALLDLSSKDITQIMGSQIDALKLRSSLTLFLQADLTLFPVADALDRFYDGTLDELTLQLLDDPISSPTSLPPSSPQFHKTDETPSVSSF